MNLPLSANWAEKDSESLLWLASYPRSGNTFTRILLANYFAADQGEYDINKLTDFIPPDTSGDLWATFPHGMEQPGGIEQTWKLRPKFIEHYRKSAKPLGFAGLKTHTGNLSVFGYPGFDFRHNDRIIYIVRHPLDVLLSYSDFNNRDLDAAISIMCQSGVCVTKDYVGGVDVRGSWNEHVSGWIAEKRCPVLLIRYEELRSDTERALEGILAYLGAPIDHQRIRRAAAASQFSKVREQEEARTFKEVPQTLKSGRFFRQGLSLQWLKELAPEQAYRLADGCGDVMQRVGYTHPREVFFDGRNAIGPISLVQSQPSCGDITAAPYSAQSAH